MPHESERVAEVREWLQKAQRDLDAATLLLHARPSLPDTALFHCQQAAEKAWKAFLFWHDVRFRKTHDLREVGDACRAVDASLTELASRAEDLTPFAWIFRYPGEPAQPTDVEAISALALAREVFDAVVTRLPGARS